MFPGEAMPVKPYADDAVADLDTLVHLVALAVKDRAVRCRFLGVAG